MNMKSPHLRITALSLAALTFLAACTPTPSPDEGLTDTTTPVVETSADTTQEASTESEVSEPALRDTYEDLSHTVAPIQGADGTSTTVTAKGDRSAPDVVLEFDGESGLFAISSTLAVECHDCATCEECGFTADGEGYFITTHNLGGAQAGMTITLATPLPIASVTGMTITYRTSGEAVNSVIRVMTSHCTTMATFQNECPSLSGASEEYRTVDLNLTDVEALVDDDGNLSVFQIYFRNKDKIDCTFKDLTICVNPEKLLVVDELEGNYFSRGDVTAAIAETIAARFEGANVGAEITVEVDKYRQNSSKMDGSIRYKATAVMIDGSTVTGEGIVVIPHVSGVWLDDSTGSFGSSHDNRGEWQETFDPSGMVLLTNNTLFTKEGVETMEYAVIPEGGAYDASDVVWMAPHLLEMTEEGFNSLFVNAWLDYADILTEGERYRLLVRGVTPHDNYVLHLDIPFAYSPLDASVTSKLTAALKTVSEASFVCPADTPDKAVYVADTLAALLNDPALEIQTQLVGVGVNSATLRVTVVYKAAVQADRLPAYTVNGEALQAVYAFAGEALTTAALNYPYTTFEGSIQLLTPFDGCPDVVLTSPEIYALWNATIKEIESGKYPFKRGENCLPTPAELTWSDAETGSKTYTVTFSKNRDLSDALTFTTQECRVSVPNLEIGQTYYWQVSDGESDSQLFTFTTAEGYPRFFALDGVSNFRDLGGYTTLDGKRVKQNMVYRSAYIDGASDEAKAFMVNELGLRTELDLRGSGSATFGKEVDRVVIAMQWYSHVFTKSNYEVVRQTISAFAYEENYPMNFHCAVGRDRTGTTAFLILGLLGVDEETLLREYYSSFFSQMASCDDEEFLKHIENIHGFMEGLARYAPGGATLQEKIEGYLLTVGVTEAEIASIRTILLED